MDSLIGELKAQIIETLNLEGVCADDIREDDQLVGGDLGIDSIDVLELVMMLEKEYAVTIDSRELGEKVLSSLGALARYIQENSPRLAG